MAFYSCKDNKVYHFPAKWTRKGWYRVDCGCSGGLQWGGDSPRECPRCGGTGELFWHKKSKVFAQYPGGSFQGREDLTDLEWKGNLKSNE